MAVPWTAMLPCDRQSLEEVAATVKGPWDLIRMTSCGDIVGLHQARVIASLVLAGEGHHVAAIIDGVIIQFGRSFDLYPCSLLDLAVQFGHIEIAFALAQRGVLPPCKLDMSNLWRSAREVSDPAWEQDPNTGWWNVNVPTCELCWGGAEEGWWPRDWHCDLQTARTSCDLPAVRAALAAISCGVEGVVELSPDVECQLLDAAVLLGEPVAAVKLAGRCGNRKPLRLWRAMDLLVVLPDDDEDLALLNSGSNVLELGVVHAAACAGINLSTLRVGEHALSGDAWYTSVGNMFEVVVNGGHEEIAKKMRKAGARPDLFDDLMMRGLLEKALRGNFDGVECALSVGVDVGAAVIWYDCDCSFCMGEFGKDLAGPLCAFDLAIIHGRLDCALRLDFVGADATPCGCAWISTIISGLMNCECFATVAPTDDIVEVLPKLLQVQYRRRVAHLFHIAAVPVLQWLGWWGRRDGDIVIYNLPLLELVLSYAAHRPALMDLCFDMTGHQWLHNMATIVGTKSGQAVNANGLRAQPLADEQVQHVPNEGEYASGNDVGDGIAQSSFDDGNDGVKDELNIEEALRLSTDEAALEESAQVAEAIVRSKADAPPLSGDDAVIYRLTCMSVRVIDVLLQAQGLSEARARVTAAGCEVRPSFANGAILLIPLTAEQLFEMELALEAHHVIALRGDLPDLERALKLVSCKKRPQLKADHRAAHLEKDDALLQQAMAARSMSEQDGVGNDRVDTHAEGTVTAVNELHSDVQLVEERTIGAVVPIVRYTFIHVPEPCDASQASTAWRSAPCSTPAEDHPQPPNPRQWRSSAR